MGGGELSAGSGGGGWWQDAEEAGERDMGSSSSSSTLDSSSEWLDSDRHYKRRKKKKKQQRSLVSRSACKNMNTGYKDKTPSAYLKIRAAQTGIVTVYKKGANLEIPEHRHREASNGFKRLIMHTSEKCTFRWIQVYFCCYMKFVFRSLIHLVWGQFVTMEEKFKGALLCLFTLHFYSLLGIIQCICVNLGFWPHSQSGVK